MDDLALSEIVLNSLQQLATNNKIPMEFITGYTLCVEGIDSEGNDMILTVVGPNDYISKSMGHIAYLQVRFDREAAAQQEDNDEA